MTVRPITAVVISSILSLGLGFAAGSLPKNSVGSPQIKNGQVASADIKNGGVTSTDVKDGTLSAADLAPGAVPTTSMAFTKNSLGGCGVSGWCYLSNAGAGTTVGSFDTPPANSTGWSSTGSFDLPQQSRVMFTADPVVWFFGSSSLDAMCSIKDGTGTLMSTGWIRSSGNEAQVLSMSGVVTLAAGPHTISMNCRSTGVETAAAVTSTMSAVIIPG